MKSRRGIAIELAILTLAITAIFCTIAVTTTLQESKFIKAELKDLDEKCTKLEYEKTIKASLKKDLDLSENESALGVGKNELTLEYEITNTDSTITFTWCKWIESSK